MKRLKKISCGFQQCRTGQIVCWFVFMVSVSAHAQPQSGTTVSGIVVKTNLLNAVMKKPTVSIEKLFSNGVSAEFSFVQGKFDNFLFTDHYRYNGFLIRGKKHISPLVLGKPNLFSGVYAGTLRRFIQSEGHITTTGFFSRPSVDFAANSIRMGVSLGATYISKNKLYMDLQGSVGGGFYTRTYWSNREHRSNAYFDTQIWLNVGYCF